MATSKPIIDGEQASERDDLMQTWILQHLFSKFSKGVLERKEDSLGKEYG